MKFNRRDIRYFLSKMAIEIPSMVFAVLLTLGVNSYWNSHQNQRMAAEMQQKIVLSNLLGVELLKSYEKFLEKHKISE